MQKPIVCTGLYHALHVSGLLDAECPENQPTSTKGGQVRTRFQLAVCSCLHEGKTRNLDAVVTTSDYE